MIEKKNDELLRMYREIIGIAEDYLKQNTKENPQAESELNVPDAAELTEISPDRLDEYISRARTACDSFDGDTMADIAKQTALYSYNGEPLKKYFGKAAELAEDFEYDAAAAELERLSAVKEGR